MSELMSTSDIILTLSDRWDLSLPTVIEKLKSVDTSHYEDVYLQVDEYYDYDITEHVINVIGIRTETESERKERITKERENATFKLAWYYSKLKETGMIDEDILSILRNKE